MHPIKIFDAEHHNLFNFGEGLNTAYRNVLPEVMVVFSEEGFFAVPSNLLIIKKMKQHVRVFENEFLNRQGITIGKAIGFENHEIRVTAEFKYQLLNEECNWIRHLLSVITSHLQQRVVEGTKLITHDNIRILIGKAVQSLEELECILRHFESSKDNIGEYITETIYRACNYLAKLAGGRAFLSSSVVEMLCTFEIVNHIYLYRRS